MKFQTIYTLGLGNKFCSPKSYTSGMHANFSSIILLAGWLLALCTVTRMSARLVLRPGLRQSPVIRLWKAHEDELLKWAAFMWFVRDSALAGTAFILCFNALYKCSTSITNQPTVISTLEPSGAWPGSRDTATLVPGPWYNNWGSSTPNAAN